MPTQDKVTRRGFLQTVGTAAGLTAMRGLAADLGEDSMLIIDCHAHIYSEDETKYPTVDKPYRPPVGAGTIAHLKREMARSGVRYVTAVQTSSFYRFDNRFTADSARDNKDFMVLETTSVDAPPYEKTDVNAQRVAEALESGLGEDLLVQYLQDIQESVGVNINPQVWSRFQNPS